MPKMDTSTNYTSSTSLHDDDQEELLLSKEKQSFDDLAIKSLLTSNELQAVNSKRVSIHKYSEFNFNNYSANEDLKLRLRLKFQGSGKGCKVLLWGPRGCGKTFWWQCLLGEAANAVREGECKMRTVVAIKVYCSSNKDELESLLDGAIKLALNGAAVVVIMDRVREISADPDKVKVVLDKLNWPVPNLYLVAACTKVCTIT